MDDMAYGESKVPLKEPTRRLKTLKAENDYLREALFRFAKHEKGCTYYPTRSPNNCSCGFNKTFARFINMDYD